MVKQWILRWLGLEDLLRRLDRLEQEAACPGERKLPIPADVMGEWLE